MANVKRGGWLKIWAISCAIILTGCQMSATLMGERGRVVRVASGQTVEVELDGRLETIRLIGLDAPDLQQSPWGVEAKQMLEDAIEGKVVGVEFDRETVDRFDRKLAYLWFDGTLVNAQIVERGYGLAISRPPNVKYETQLQHASARARLLGLGIWNPETPMRQTPGEFRRQRANSDTKTSL
ncbi:MAG: thermonuclease family protein [Cyanobacteria bacterium SBC]|nr:thermonuclease family protein [Cyanobacteria bacterium SBC]